MPVTDAAGLARPDLNPRIGRLRIERIAMPVRELCSRRTFWLFHAKMCNPVVGRYFARNRFRLRARPRSRTFVIGSGLDRERRELRGGPQRLRRQHRLRQVKVEELAGAVLIRRSTAHSMPAKP